VVFHSPLNGDDEQKITKSTVSDGLSKNQALPNWKTCSDDADRGLLNKKQTGVSVVIYWVPGDTEDRKDCLDSGSSGRTGSWFQKTLCTGGKGEDRSPKTRGGED